MFGEDIPDSATDETNDSSPVTENDASQSSDETLPDATPDAESDIAQNTSAVDPQNLIANMATDTSVPDPDSDADMSATSSSPTITYKKIAITDIHSLPKPNWYLCNNSFLIHGFFNYHYLILKTIESKEKTQRFLGVPGVYEHPERMMALLFGFPTFEPAQADDVPLSGVFGYWMLELS